MSVVAAALPTSESAGADPSFDRALAQHGLQPLARAQVQTLQVNLGKRCNMTCQHCHVEAGPNRTEMMSGQVAARVIELLERNPDIDTVDFTGGAPELNPHFRWLVSESRKLGRRVIDRCNLTVFFEPAQSDTPAFLAAHDVEVVASLPCYGAANVEKQRGKGAFDKSIQALLLLNQLGYGKPESRLRLNLVYNPVGPSLPPAQHTLQATYKEELSRLFGIAFNDLLTITNLPINRFAGVLRAAGTLSVYKHLLVDRFNPATVPELMCRSMVSVGWDGQLYDCDFNQMLELPLGAGARTVWNIESLAEFDEACIATGGHCFGCTAGAGSSCAGALQ